MEVFIRQFLFNRKWKPLRHLSFWGFLYLDELLSILGITEVIELPWLILPQLALDVLTVYLTIYLLMPRLFSQKKYGHFFLWTLLLVIINTVTYIQIESIYFDFDYDVISMYISSIVVTLSIVGTAIAIKLLKNQVLEVEARELLTIEKNKVELQYLKDQINPHFLFNVLNTIYVQTKINPEQASEAIMKLSDLLRYQIYEVSEKEKIALSTEIEFLENYIALEKLRRENLNVEWQIAENLKGLSIAPFLFLPLVENALKHSKSSKTTNTHISIQCFIKEEKLQFICSNTIGDNVSKEGGFGLKNLDKRLQLIYPGKYVLRIHQKDSTFIAELSIQLNEIYNNR